MTTTPGAYTPPKSDNLRWPYAFAEATIDAPLERIWALLTDFASYDDWNPFTYAVQMPRFAVEEQFAFTVRMSAQQQRYQREILTVVDAPYCLAWRYARPGVFLRAVRYQVLHPTEAGGTRYQTWEKFDGWLAPVIGWTVLSAVQRGFDDVAQALKATAEA